MNPIRFLFKGKTYHIEDKIYFPSEDSYFLAENVKIKKGETVIDMGCGSGIQSLNCLAQGASKVTAIDINKKAVETTKKNCETAGYAEKITAIKSDLFSECGENADVIIFNPPYVATDNVKYVELDGGKNGREILDRFLDEMPNYLKQKGRCIFLQTNINGYEETMTKLQKKGFECAIIARRNDFFEELAVFSCSRGKDFVFKKTNV
ncbi:MAG: hypothetical protein COV47_05570 [Candidatus Diapherotrites archaeon CG11_big_fil_rev_8_21_14_0_20_37_9]|nr:MAG: hypothetical protein COV47_05570 [Candidatus Diapherotrites archaeon CG11_big_fil_rev_8_21_14_0_20_37_9]